MRKHEPGDGLPPLLLLVEQPLHMSSTWPPLGGDNHQKKKKKPITAVFLQWTPSTSSPSTNSCSWNLKQLTMMMVLSHHPELCLVPLSAEIRTTSCSSYRLYFDLIVCPVQNSPTSFVRLESIDIHSFFLPLPTRRCCSFCVTGIWISQLNDGSSGWINFFPSSSSTVGSKRVFIKLLLNKRRRNKLSGHK